LFFLPIRLNFIPDKKNGAKSQGGGVNILCRPENEVVINPLSLTGSFDQWMGDWLRFISICPHIQTSHIPGTFGDVPLSAMEGFQCLGWSEITGAKNEKIT